MDAATTGLRLRITFRDRRSGGEIHRWLQLFCINCRYIFSNVID